MSPDTGYQFDDELPLSSIPGGTTVMVAGPALSRAENLALSLVADGSDREEGMLFISTNKACQKLLDNCRRSNPAFESTRAGVIDCSGQSTGQKQFDAAVRSISTQKDLTGIGMRFSALYEQLYADASNGRVRTGLISLSSLSMYVDLRSLFQFAQTLSGRIDSAGGLGVFAIDPSAHDTKTVNTLSQVADGRIEVREHEGEGDLRVRGLADQHTDWQPFSLSRSSDNGLCSGLITLEWPMTSTGGSERG